MKKTVRLLLTIALLGGGMVSAQNKDAENDNSEGMIFTVVEEEPASFPGGEDEMYKFIAKNLQYPEEAKKKGIEGKVHVSFVVEVDGSITDVKVLRDIGGGRCEGCEIHAEMESCQTEWRICQNANDIAFFFYVVR